MFAAIDDETQAAKYYAFAAVYALPLIRNGFQFDSFLAVAVLLCAAHVQVGWHAAFDAFDRQGYPQKILLLQAFRNVLHQARS